MWWTTIDFEKLANAILILIIGIGGFFGINQARKNKSDSKGDQIELAGAVINGEDAKALAAAFDKAAANMASLGASLAAHQIELAEHRKALDSNTRTFHDDSDHIATEMRNLANALLLSRR